MTRQAEKLLHPHGKRWASVRRIIERYARSRRRLEMGRRFFLEALTQVPWQEAFQGLLQIVRRDRRKTGLVFKMRREPFRGLLRERRIGQIGPGVVGLEAAQEKDPIAPLAQSLVEGEPIDPERRDPFGERAGGGRPRRDGQVLFA